MIVIERVEVNAAEKHSLAVFTEWETKLLFLCFTVLLKSVRAHLHTGELLYRLNY